MSSKEPFGEMTLLEHFGLSEASKKNILNWKSVEKSIDSKIGEFNIKATPESKMHELSEETTKGYAV